MANGHPNVEPSLENIYFQPTAFNYNYNTSYQTNEASSVANNNPNIGPHRSSSASAGTMTNDDVATTVEEEEEYDNDCEEYADSDEVDSKSNNA